LKKKKRKKLQVQGKFVDTNRKHSTLLQDLRNGKKGTKSGQAIKLTEMNKSKGRQQFQGKLMRIHHVCAKGGRFLGNVGTGYVRVRPARRGVKKKKNHKPNGETITDRHLTQTWVTQERHKKRAAGESSKESSGGYQQAEGRHRED